MKPRVRASALRAAVALAVCIATASAGCSDQRDPGRLTEPAIKPITSDSAIRLKLEPQSTCSNDCDFLSAPMPGEATMTLGRGTAGNGVDSVYWPVSFPEETYVRITVSGMLPRAYVNPIQGYPTI